TVPSDARGAAAVVSRGYGVVAGLDAGLLVLDEVLGPEGYRVLERVPDGTPVRPGTTVLRLDAPTRGMLTAERTMLNLVCHLSGIASRTAQWAAEAAGTDCRIRDSRKTL